MASTLGDFTLSAVAAPDDFIVGYDEAALNGERRWTVSTISKAVSGISKGAIQDGLLSKLGSSVTPAADFNTFTTGSIPNATDKLVGFVSTSAGGERKWDISTIANAVSGLIQQEILNKAMTTIGNYPYLEYAWVTAPNTAAQSIASDNTFKTLTLNSEIADSGNHGSLDAVTSRITLAAGTYRFEMSVPYKQTYNTNTTVISMLFNITDNNPIRSNSHAVDSLGLTNTTILEGQFTISSQKVLELQTLNNSAAANPVLIKSGHMLVDPTNSSAGYDQRTTIRLWKVG